MPKDYSKGKIYSVRSDMTDKVYIGSTVSELSVRMGKHRNQYKSYLKGEGTHTRSIEILKYPDAYIELIEFYPCSCIEELERREGEIQREHDNRVNYKIARRTPAEYYIDNIEYVKEKSRKYHHENKEDIKVKRDIYYQENKDMYNNRSKKYYEENKDEILDKRKIKYECSCGSTIRVDTKVRHEKSQKHQNFTNSKL